MGRAGEECEDQSESEKMSRGLARSCGDVLLSLLGLRV